MPVIDLASGSVCAVDNPLMRLAAGPPELTRDPYKGKNDNDISSLDEF